MTITDSTSVDVMGLNDRGEVVMIIWDPLDWSSCDADLESAAFHADLLKKKVEFYIAFFESGKLADELPAAEGRNVVIKVAAKHPMTARAQENFGELQNIITARGVSLRFELAVT